MSSYNEVDALIAQLVANYKQPEVSAPQKLIKLNRGESKLALAKAAKEAAKTAELAAKATQSNSQSPALVTMVLPVPSPEHCKSRQAATDYMISMRRASTRDERIMAIATYMGYDTHRQYGEQEYAANTLANQVLRGIPKAKEFKHGAHQSIAGYQTGVPDPIAKWTADLNGRIVMATQQVFELEQQAAAHRRRGDEVNGRHFDLLAQAANTGLAQLKVDLRNGKFPSDRIGSDSN